MLRLQFCEDMDEQVDRGCVNPECDCAGEPLHIVPKCHARAGLTMEYFEGIALLACIVCQKPVLRLAIAIASEGET